MAYIEFPPAQPDVRNPHRPTARSADLAARREFIFSGGSQAQTEFPPAQPNAHTPHYPSARAAVLASRREFVAGMLITVGICWPFLFSSVWDAPWWVFPPFAIVAGFMRRRSSPCPLTPLVPLWGFFLVLIAFALFGYAADPMTPYGVDKLWHFALLASIAYLGAGRQKPVTETLLRGMRQALLLTFILSIIIAFKNRDLFMFAESEGIKALRAAFSITAFPLIIALGAAWAVPRTLVPFRLLCSGALLLAGAALEVFVRGRFDAIMLVLLAGLVVLGPPFRHYIVRLPLAVLLVFLGVAIYVNVLPQMGDSFLYLSWTDPASIGGRSGLYTEAINGFQAYPFGQGIGSFAHVEPTQDYPHNIILESAYELGICGLLCMLGIYFFVFRRITQYWLSPPHRIIGAILLLLFSHMLKVAPPRPRMAFPMASCATIVIRCMRSH